MIRDLLIAIGIVFLAEGIFFTLFPVTMRKIMKASLTMSDSTLRYLGLAAVFIGFFLIYAVK
ncbi:MAG: DUF2065 domain-containing protein [Emcibacter sp.]|nr:DUF2065 domain-containing protein [Emcibacter sp.]